MLRHLLQWKLVSQVTKKDDDTLVEASRRVVKQVSEWLRVPLPDDRRQYQEPLMALLSANRDLPRQPSEWNRLLSQWLRHNTVTGRDLVKDRTVYRLLAVDGFLGFKPKDLKKYLSNVLDEDLRRDYRRHAEGIRRMYDQMDSSLTGTHSACVVFLALLKGIEDRLTIHDQNVLMHLHRIRVWTEGFLHQDAEYYETIRNVDGAMLDRLMDVYTEQDDDDGWKRVAEEQVKLLDNFLNDQ